MATPSHDSNSLPASARDFATTHWSVVLSAGAADGTQSQDALAHLCQLYWFPLYAFVRRRGESPHDAQDLTQAFFAFLLKQNSFAVADPQRGKFRSFLLGSLKNFLANERARAQALKRGGGKIFVAIDDDSAEARYAAELTDHLTPERIFERQWARAVLADALNTLRAEYHAAKKLSLFESLKECLTTDKQTLPYATLAAHNQMSEGAVKVAVHRLRHRYRTLLRVAVARTLDLSEDVDAEIRLLFQALGN